MTSSEVGKILGLSKRRVNELARNGYLRAEKHGPIYWIHPEDLRRFVLERLAREEVAAKPDNNRSIHPLQVRFRGTDAERWAKGEIRYVPKKQ